jgi:hypothetical protein
MKIVILLFDVLPTFHYPLILECPVVETVCSPEKDHEAVLMFSTKLTRVLPKSICL